MEQPPPGTHLCWHCATKQGLARDVDPDGLLRSSYQFEKFLKHTVLDSLCSHVSVFSDPSVSVYKDWVVNSMASGCVAFDSRGPSYVFVAGRQVGLEYKKGSFHTVGDSVKVVLPFDPFKVHAYPISSHVVTAKMCARCGAPVAG
jgi:hypothetical protein